MSVATTADKNRDKAKREIEQAISNLAEIVVNQCWGWDEYHPRYFKALRKSLDELLDIRDRLNDGWEEEIQ